MIFTNPSTGALAAGARVGGERESADLHATLLLFQLFLGLADRSGLGRGVDDARNGVVVDVRRLARHRFDRGDAFLLGLVRQHGPGDRVADGEYPFHAGLEPPVDGDEPAVVALDPRPLQPEAVGEWPPPDRDQDRVAVEGLAAAAADRLKRHPQGVFPPLGTDHPGGGPERHALPFEQAGHLPGDLAIHCRQDAVEILDDGHPRAQPLPDRSQLEPDIAAADHDKMARHGP